MENYAGLLPFLWRTFKKPQEKKAAPEMVPLSMHEDGDDAAMHLDDDEYFLHSELVTKSSPGMLGKSHCHKRRHSTGLNGFSLPKLLSSQSQRAR